MRIVTQEEPERRWGAKERVDNEDDARERLLNAAEACFERYGLRRTTIDDVAREAMVSRSTVYRYFENRSDLIVGMYLRENQAVTEKIKALMGKSGTFSDRLVNAMLRSIEGIRSGTYLGLLLTPEGALLASNIVTASEAFYDSCRSTMRPFVEAAQSDGELRTDISLDDFIEWMLRILFSFAMVEGRAEYNARNVRRMIETFLIPALEP